MAGQSFRFTRNRDLQLRGSNGFSPFSLFCINVLSGTLHHQKIKYLDYIAIFDFFYFQAEFGNEDKDKCNVAIANPLFILQI
jgi:hypothetical protein